MHVISSKFMYTTIHTGIHVHTCEHHDVLQNARATSTGQTCARRRFRGTTLPRRRSTPAATSAGRSTLGPWRGTTAQDRLRRAATVSLATATLPTDSVCSQTPAIKVVILILNHLGNSREVSEV